MKSTVSVEQKKCLVCSTLYETGALVIKGPSAPTSPLEWGLCPDHAALRNRNLIAMVEIDPAKSRVHNDEFLDPAHAHRTGVVVYLSRNVFQDIFYGDPPDNGVCYVPPEVVATLQQMGRLWQDTQKDH